MANRAHGIARIREPVYASPMKRWLPIGLVVIAALACALGRPSAQENLEDVRERAFEALESGDLPAAARMLQQLGDDGVAQGYTMLGEMKRDLGDATDAARWFERGAQGGDTQAMVQGAVLLTDPAFGLNDARRAFRLWAAAAEKGIARAQFEAGSALMSATGTRRDEDAGADWLEKAAGQCQGDAQLAYALALREGRGRTADGEEALAWLIAAERARNDWTEADLERFAALEREIQAYMSSEQVKGAYCRGLDLFADSCGRGDILSRLERWLYCK